MAEFKTILRKEEIVLPVDSIILPDKENRIYRALEKILKQLKFGEEKETFLTILEKLLDLGRGSVQTSALRRHVFVKFLDELENGSIRDFSIKLQDFENLFVPKQLRKFTKEVVQINHLSEFARGGFGIIYIGDLKKSGGSVQKVAIKVAKVAWDQKYEDMLFNEAKIMAQFDHKNVVKLLAFQKSPLKVVMEYLELKNLELAIQNGQITNVDALKVLYDVAAAMEYISTKKYVHRDLACRNVFVGSDKVCKVGDFGLSRYFGSAGKYQEKEHQLKMYNTAPEAKLTQIFSTTSDVWSFGILILELYNTLEEPFSFYRIIFINKAVDMLCITNMLQCLKTCPEILCAYLEDKILNFYALARPSFTDIKEKIGQMLLKYRSGVTIKKRNRPPNF